MKKYISIIICLILFLSVQAMPVFAESIDNVSACIDSNKLVTISGVLSSDAGQVVNIKIAAPGGGIEYLNSTVSTTWGNFEFSYTMTNIMAGRYAVTVNAAGVSSPVKTYFDYGVDNDLKALSISGGIPDEVFSPETTGYTVTVDKTVKSITVTPTVNDNTAGVKVNDAAVMSGMPSKPVMLSEGTNIISVDVTALNGNIKRYIINVTRKVTISTSLTANAAINADELVTLSGFISSGAGQYVSVIITDPGGSTEYINEIPSASGGMFQFSYHMSNNAKGRYNVAVGALGVTPPVTTHFDYGMDADLKNLSMTSAGLSPEFQSGVTSYTASVSNSIKSITVTPTASDGSAVIKVNNIVVSDGRASAPIMLFTGANTINVVVMAQDGITSKTYSITVNKDKPLPTSASVWAEISREKQVAISGAIGSGGGQQVSVMILDPNGKIEYLETATSAIGGGFQFSYTMSNTTRGRYDVTIGAAGLLPAASTYFIYDPGNAGLKDLAISNAFLNSIFLPEVTEYTAYVGYNTGQVRVIPTAMDSIAAVKVNDMTVENGNASGDISLDVGYNTIRVVVISQDATTTKTYTINITRSGPPSPPEPPPVLPPA